MTRFSIIVPVYGVENFIRQCIDSILSQTYSDFELILVDDGSKDSSPSICDEYARVDKRVRVIHKLNGGLVSARKAGAEVATGEFIACVDGDDWVEPNYLELLGKIADFHNPDVICFGYREVFMEKHNDYNTGFSEGLMKRDDIEKNIFPILIESYEGRTFVPSIWSKAFKRDIYINQQLSVANEIKIGEDQACTRPIIYNAKSLYCCNEILYNYRFNNTSMTKMRKSFDLLGPKMIGQHFASAMDISEFGIKEQIERSVIHLLFNACCTQFYRDLPYKTIKKQIEDALDDDYYKQIINNCSFSKRNLKKNFALFAIRYRMIFLLKAYSIMS